MGGVHGDVDIAPEGEAKIIAFQGLGRQIWIKEGFWASSMACKWFCFT